MSDWTHNTTIPELAAWLTERISINPRVAVLTHAKPDGDALGSTAALVRTLNTIGADAHAYYTGSCPPWTARLLGDTPHTPLANNTQPEGDFGAIVVCDTGSWSQLNHLDAFVRPHHAITAVIDHHLRGDGDMAPRRLIETHSAAACQPVGRLCAHLAGLTPSKLPVETASLLYLGLATDTGWFRFSSVTPDTLRLAADLLETGVDQPTLYAIVMQRDRPARLTLMARALTSATFEAGGEFVVMRLTNEDMQEARGTPDDTGGFADLALSITSVRATALVTEVEGEPVVKASLRSKPGPGMVNVSNVAARMGGGGHANAAGVKQTATLDQAVENIINAYHHEREQNQERQQSPEPTA